MRITLKPIALFLAIVWPIFASAQGSLDVPAHNSNVSGFGIVSGWYCNAGSMAVSIDGGPAQRIAYGSERADTAPICGDSDNGFGFPLNYNVLGTGPHQIQVFADGQFFASATVYVTTPGTSYLTGVSRQIQVNDFPYVGNQTMLTWEQAQQAFVISGFSQQAQTLNGTYQLHRVSVNYLDGQVFDSLANISANGTMTISGNYISQNISITSNGQTQQITTEDNFQDLGYEWSFLSGGQLIVLQRTPYLMTLSTTPANGGIPGYAEVDQWIKVSGSQRSAPATDDIAPLQSGVGDLVGSALGGM